MEPPKCYHLSDEVILERSKIWSNVMTQMCEEEDYREIDIYKIETETDSEEISDDEAIENNLNNNSRENNCKALVKSENFEGSTSSDDFDECANETLALIQERKRKWEECGMVKVLETFDLDQIAKKVVPWIEKNKLDNSHNGNNSTSIDEHIVHIEEHHHRQIHLGSDDDSLHSLDTANYIRSSRNKKTSSCTTTTIKKFSYVKGSRKHLQNKYGLNGFDVDRDLGKGFYDKVSKATNRAAAIELLPETRRKSTNFMHPLKSKALTWEPKSAPVGRRRSRQLKRRSGIPKRSISSSSSSSGSPQRHLKPKFRRSSLKNSFNLTKLEKDLEAEKPTPLKKRPRGRTIHKIIFPDVKSPSSTESTAIVDLTKLESSATESTPPRKKSIPSVKQRLKRPNVLPGVDSANSNETGFLGASLINSTSLPNTSKPSLPNPPKKCLISPIKVRSEHDYPVEAHTKSSSNPTPDHPSSNPIKSLKSSKEDQKQKTTQHQVPQDKTKILLFCPTNLGPHKENLVGNRFKLTREYFSETVGKKNSRRFIKLNSKKFPFEFDSTSTVYFKLYNESEAGSSSSDEDILYMFGRQGKIIEEPMAMEEDLCE